MRRTPLTTTPRRQPVVVVVVQLVSTVDKILTDTSRRAVRLRQQSMLFDIAGARYGRPEAATQQLSADVRRPGQRGRC